MFCVYVQPIQILLGVHSVQLECRQKGLRSQLIAAADHIADGALEIITRHEVTGRGFQLRFTQREQLRLDVVHLALRFDRRRGNTPGWCSDRMLKRRPIGNAMQEQGRLVRENNLR